MNYEEKLMAYRRGELDEKQTTEVEADIEKFTALLDFVDEKAEPAKLNQDSSHVNLADSLNKALNRRINLTVTRTVLTVLLFGFLFVFGLFLDNISQALGGDEIATYVMCGVYSTVHMVTVFCLLHRLFVKKEKAPGILLILWVLGLTALTFAVSTYISDFAGFLLPAYYGFSGITQALTDLFDFNFSVTPVITVASMVATVLLAVAGLVMCRTKKTTFKPIAPKALKIGISVFCVVSLTVTAGSTVKRINHGGFPDTILGSYAMEKELMRDKGALFTYEYIGKSIDDITLLLGDDYVTDLSLSVDKGMPDTERMVAFYKKNSATMLHVRVEQDGRVVGSSYNTGFRCVNPYVDTQRIEEIKNGSLNGKTLAEVIDYLYSVRLIPMNADYAADSTVLTIYVNMKATEHSFAMTELIYLEFKDGRLVSSGNDL